MIHNNFLLSYILTSLCDLWRHMFSWTDHMTLSVSVRRVASVSLCSCTLTDGLFWAGTNVQCLMVIWCGSLIKLGFQGLSQCFSREQVNRKAFGMDAGAAFVLSGRFCEHQCWGMLLLSNVVYYCVTNDGTLLIWMLH